MQMSGKLSVPSRLQTFLKSISPQPQLCRVSAHLILESIMIDVPVIRSAGRCWFHEITEPANVLRVPNEIHHCSCVVFFF